MPPGEEACLCINQEHFLSTYPPMQQRNVAYWWFLTEGQPTIPVLADRNYLLEAGLFLQSSAKGWVKCPKRDLEILIEKSIPTSLPFPPIQMSPFTWVTTSSASTMAIWRRTGPMVSNGEVICWRTTGKLGFSIGTSSITEVRVCVNEAELAKSNAPRKRQGWRWSHPALPDLSDSEKFASKSKFPNWEFLILNHNCRGCESRDWRYPSSSSLVLQLVGEGMDIKTWDQQSSQFQKMLPWDRGLVFYLLQLSQQTVFQVIAMAQSPGVKGEGRGPCGIKATFMEIFVCI